MYSQFLIISLTNFIFYFVLFINLLTLTLLTLITFVSLNYTSLDLYKYKINNSFITFSIIILYISIFIIFFYCLRLYNIGHYLDLKQLYISIKIILNTFFVPLQILHKLIILFYFIIIVLFILILMLSMIKKAQAEIFNFYIYVKGYPLTGNIFNLRFKLLNKLTKFLDSDIISYSLHHFIEKISLKYKNVKKYPEHYDYFGCNINNVLVYNKKYKLFVQFSPIFFLLYDSLFNNWILIHFYYYMLIFTPIILFRNITTAMVKTNGGFVDILWQIYYTKDNHICYIANKEQREIINIFLRANVGYVHELSIDNMLEFCLLGSLTYHLQDSKNNIYWNNDANYLKIEKNKIYEIVEDENGNNIYIESKDYVIL